MSQKQEAMRYDFSQNENPAIGWFQQKIGRSRENYFYNLIKLLRDKEDEVEMFFSEPVPKLGILGSIFCLRNLIKTYMLVRQFLIYFQHWLIGIYYQDVFVLINATDDGLNIRFRGPKFNLLSEPQVSEQHLKKSLPYLPERYPWTHKLPPIGPTAIHEGENFNGKICQLTWYWMEYPIIHNYSRQRVLHILQQTKSGNASSIT